MTVQPVEKFSPYSTISAFGAELPSIYSPHDVERIKAYQVYEQIYWDVPETFKLTMRGDDDNPIYIPTARTIVDTTDRFICAEPGFVIDPDVGSDSEQALAKTWLTALFRRERWWSKFNSSKTYGIMRGDWVWHIIGNDLKPQGSRIKIEPVDPAAYFPVTHPDDPDRIIAVHIMEQFTDANDEVFIKRQTYTKGADPVNNDGSDTSIWNSIAIMDTEAWQNLSDKPVKVIKEPTALPPMITAIPLYHIKNIETPGDPFGSSDIRGFERIMAAVNQAISDEELTLALEGLGMYATDGGPPRDEQGAITDWVLGPGRVVEHTNGSKFARVSGVGTVEPYQSHLSFLINSLKEASATPDAAVGKVDVSIAESGISLLLQLSPMLAKRNKREDQIGDVLTQMYFDLNSWLEAYEGVSTPAVAIPVWGDAVPVDREKRFQEIMLIWNNGAGLADDDWARTELEKLGFNFDATDTEAVLNMMKARADAVDPFATRAAGEVTAETEGTATP